MKHSILVFILIIILSIAACRDLKSDIIRDEEITYGLRHDLNLKDYLIPLQNNQSDIPDFDPIICFSYSLDGSDYDDYIASGILIHPYWVLTAGHNFYVKEEQDEAALPGGIFVLTGNDPNNPDNKYHVEKLVFFPTWFEENEDFVKANDLCLVKLKKPIRNIKPAVLFNTKNEKIGSKIWFCGFGDYSVLFEEDPDLLSPKHAIENILDRKVDGIKSYSKAASYSGGLLAFDFDNPDGTINSLGDSFINDDEALLGKGTSKKEALKYEGTTVEGDSGGGLFVKDKGTWKLAGILSGGASEPIYDHEDASYGDISIFIRVSSHIDWINSVIK